MYYAAAAALLGVGATMGGWVLLMTVVCRWFVRRRATAIGLAHMVSSLGPVFVLPFIFLVAHSEGWRLSAIMLGGSSLVVAFVALAWLRNRPEEMGLLPNGASVLPLQGSFSVFQALRTRAFWFIALADGLAAAEILKLTDFVGSLRASQAEVMVLLPTSLSSFSWAEFWATAIPSRSCWPPLPRFRWWRGRHCFCPAARRFFTCRSLSWQ